MSALVCFALNAEAAPFRKIAAAKAGVAVLVVGIGRQNAERALRAALAHNSPDLVLTCGFAGGLAPALQAGVVVFETGVSAGPEVAGWQARLLAAGARPAKFFCADRIATTAAEKARLRAETGADAVEMESAAIQAVCRERGLPCLTVRVISDAADEDLPLDFNALARPDKSLHAGKLALAIARAPGKIGALMALGRKTALAARQLATVLEQVIG